MVTAPQRSAPQSEHELLQRANALAGQSLSSLSAAAHITMPHDLRRAKGWVGQLIEWQLGAMAGSKPEQDFPELGIELKTLPIDAHGKPLESTFVCVTPLIGITGLRWESSNVRNKLSRVLWIPVEGSRHIPLAVRRVATPFIWSPDPEDEALLRQDWEELMELVALGQIESITAHHGEVLQLRPKAANGQALTAAIGKQGQLIQTRPRGFYLRSSFTQRLLQRAFFSE
jgi:DNA mismatch repair protein MutH